MQQISALNQKPVIVWLRRDLRLADNPALCAAASTANPVIILYMLEDEADSDWKIGGASSYWLYHSLKSLQSDLKNLQSNLVILRGDPSEVFKKLVHQTGATCIYFNKSWEPSCHEEKIQSSFVTKSYPSSLLFEPGDILTKEGKPFQVFTPFWNACLKSTVQHPLKAPKKINSFQEKVESLSIEDLHLLPSNRWDLKFSGLWKIGEKAAFEKLQAFLTQDKSSYVQNRDFPSVDATSLLSSHLHFGEISARQVFYAAETHDTFIRQLGWREFSCHMLSAFPKTPLEPLRSGYKNFPWHLDSKVFRLWKKGQTGYPIVDAGMRQLWETGYMHNRVRMIVGSFLVKHLMIPWQEGARYFWDTLVDADLANNTMGWQWVAGCGADAAPYFRIFNPILQGEKFDPEGTYVKKYVPELKDVPAEWIHKPWEAPTEVLKSAGLVLGKNYPLPIIDHKKGRERALSSYESWSRSCSDKH